MLREIVEDLIYFVVPASHSGDAHNRAGSSLHEEASRDQARIPAGGGER